MKPENTSQHNLDALLQDWTGRHTLSAAQSETIRRAVLFPQESPAAELTVAWWNQLFVPLTTALKQSADINRCLLPASIR